MGTSYESLAGPIAPFLKPLATGKTLTSNALFWDEMWMPGPENES
jgi:hypothetical protein